MLTSSMIPSDFFNKNKKDLNKYRRDYEHVYSEYGNSTDLLLMAKISDFLKHDRYKRITTFARFALLQRNFGEPESLGGYDPDVLALCAGCKVEDLPEDLQVLVVFPSDRVRAGFDKARELAQEIVVNPSANIQRLIDSYDPERYTMTPLGLHVVNNIRHRYTNYDELLKIHGIDKNTSEYVCLREYLLDAIMEAYENVDTTDGTLYYWCDVDMQNTLKWYKKEEMSLTMVSLKRVKEEIDKKFEQYERSVDNCMTCNKLLTCEKANADVKRALSFVQDVFNIKPTNRLIKGRYHG